MPSIVPEGGTRGWIIPIGGAENKENDRHILERFVHVSGGRDADIVVIPTASRLTETGPRYEKLFRDIGAPVIAFAEIALLIEAIVLFKWLSNRTHGPIRVGGAVTRGLVAALVGGVTAYSLAWFVPGGAVVTALLGMSVGGLVALAIVWQDVRKLLHL